MGHLTLIVFWIFLLVGLKEACMPNFSLLGSYFTTTPVGWRASGWLKESKIRLTQPSLARTGAELGKKLRKKMRISKKNRFQLEISQLITTFEPQVLNLPGADPSPED